jgi:F-type H+-transporting ATPase subunit c
MNTPLIFAIVCIMFSGVTITIGSIGPALSQGRAVDSALDAIAASPMPPTGSAVRC